MLDLPANQGLICPFVVTEIAGRSDQEGTRWCWNITPKNSGIKTPEEIQQTLMAYLEQALARSTNVVVG
jgi:hypothetical protein